MDGGSKPDLTPGGPAPPSSAQLLEAALGYVARGWPVFPCNPKNKQPLLAAKKGEDGKPIKGTGGVSAASTDPDQVTAWWKKWPQALIGLACGHPTKETETGVQPAGLCLFVLDFDPRTDPDTGEVWTLDRLKRETEEQLGCALPLSMAALTPSDGVHLYLLKGDGGPPITNRGNLPQHVDVRGLGGYVIAPPSVMGPGAAKGQSGLRYRWHRREPIGGIAKAPDRLLEVLRERGGKGVSRETSTDPAKVSSPLKSQQTTLTVDDAVRKYALSALDGELQAVRTAPSGQRNAQLNTSALKIASLVAAGALEATLARLSLEAAARDNPGNDDDRQLTATIGSGWTAGLGNPRDLSEIAAAARERSERGPYRSRSSSPRTPPVTANGEPSSREGGAGGQDGKTGAGGEDVTRKCAFRPLTDLGNLERFMERFGGDFLYVEAWGWLAWDGRRWNREMALPMLGHAVQKTMRAIQEEAASIRESGLPEAPLDLWPAEQKAEHEAAQRHKLDRVLESKRGKIVLLSDTIAKWGRTSEGAGHINCIARLAEARLSARTEDFDADPLKLNVENGTIVFLRPDQEYKASWSKREHRRDDRLTKLAKVVHDARAACPRFSAFLARVQPDPEMQSFLDCWAGYSSLGLADAQKMALFYGEGSNGKGVWITTLAAILGDYAWKTGVETFIDQGRYRKGSDASPDLAALAGRRMVYANEPEDNSKFSDGLVKAMTSDEPLGGVRELNKSPFELPVTFNNTVLANNLPRIGTDHGIQRRMQVVPWDVIIPDEEQDLQLKAKLMEEASGILNRMVAGALAYLDDGLPIPEAVKEATREYQEENDLLGEFIRLCVARVPGEIVGATAFNRAFAAWQTWANKLPQSGKPWSPKFIYGQMKKKRFRDGKSSTKQWHDIALRYIELDFVTLDEAGRMHPVERELPPPKTFADEIIPTGPSVTAAEHPPPHPSYPDVDDSDLPH